MLHFPEGMRKTLFPQTVKWFENIMNSNEAKKAYGRTILCKVPLKAFTGEIKKPQFVIPPKENEDEKEEKNEIQKSKEEKKKEIESHKNETEEEKKARRKPEKEAKKKEKEKAKNKEIEDKINTLGNKEEKNEKEEEMSSKKSQSYNEYDFIGQITGSIRECCRKAYLCAEPRLYEAYYLCIFQINQDCV